MDTQMNDDLRRMLLPGTTEDIALLYEGLADTAREQDFGPLEDGVVVLDTETTGLSFRNCELIEIAAARISGKTVEARYQTFVNPGKPIPPEIQKLTGIRAIDVAGAPTAEEAVAGLADFAGGAPILAHNASFDRTFVEKVPGGKEVSDLWIDTLSLSRIALPRLRTHRLADMATAFGCASVTHRAMDDVDALCGMWPILLAGISSLPTGLPALLADMHPEHPWAFRPILSYLAGLQEQRPFSLKETRHELIAQVPWHTRDDAATVEVLHAPSAPELEEAFAEDGLVADLYERYEQRAEQKQMSLEVRSAFATSTHRAIEAGTGVGKSMAYLVPAALFAQRNHVTIGVATKTNALTDQLVSHELPALAEALPHGLTWASLKGYDHYPCLNRLQRATMAELPQGMATNGSSQTSQHADMLTAIAVIYANVCQAAEMDLDALGIRWRSMPRSMLTTRPAECQRTHCPFFPHECLVHGARRRAGCADVVVTNHSLLLRNVAAEGKILPPIRHWIVDEAHGFETEARRQWACEIAPEKVRSGFEKLGGTKTGVLHALYGRLEGQEASELPLRLLTKLSAAASRAQLAMAEVFDQLHALREVAGQSGGYDTQTLWIDAGLRATEAWGRLRAALDQATERLAEASKDADAAAAALADMGGTSAGDLREACVFLDELQQATALIAAGEDTSYVYSALLVRHNRDRAQESLIAEKVDIGTDLATRWLPEMSSVVYTSATMAVGSSFEHFEHAVGLDQLPAGQHASLQLASCFDFDRNMSVLVCRDLPAPGSRGYLDALVDLLFDVHKSMGGSVLTLFTNRREMEQAHRALAPRLAAVGLEVDCQDRNSSPRRLRERFMADETRSLMALRAFWEGFDAAGDTLRCVVIAKLPFANPGDPLVRERDLREQRAWWRYSLPEAVLATKQAAGRLIRTATDEGIVVFADSRVATKRYGAQFVNSMPTKNCTTLDAAHVGRYIDMWRASRRR